MGQSSLHILTKGEIAKLDLPWVTRGRNIAEAAA
jgi:hypothetical protein